MAVLLGTIWPASGGLLASTAGRLSQDAGLCFVVFFTNIFSSPEPRKVLPTHRNYSGMPVSSILSSKPQIHVENPLYAIHRTRTTNYEKSTNFSHFALILSWRCWL